MMIPVGRRDRCRHRNTNTGKYRCHDPSDLILESVQSVKQVVLKNKDSVSIKWFQNEVSYQQTYSKQVIMAAPVCLNQFRAVK